MDDIKALNCLLNLKRRERLVYNSNVYPWPCDTGNHNLKVISKPKLSGDYWLVKCKVIGGENWYKEIFITMADFKEGRINSG